MFYKALGVFNVVGGLTYQLSNDVGQLFCHSISDHIPTGNNGPLVDTIYVDFEEFVKYGGALYLYIKVFSKYHHLVCLMF